MTREPGGTPLGEKIRRLVLNPHNHLSPETELLLISAARKDHVENIIKPALKKSKWVLCDRFWASTAAFQGGGRKLPLPLIQQMNKIAVGDMEPDLWILLDLPLKEKAKRQKGKNSADTFESQNESFHQRVKNTYLQLAKQDKKHWRVLDATLPVKQLTRLALQEIQKKWNF